jgi:hypothetical protein
MKEETKIRIIRALLYKRSHYQRNFKHNKYFEGWLDCEKAIIKVLDEVQE